MEAPENSSPLGLCGSRHHLACVCGLISDNAYHLPERMQCISLLTPCELRQPNFIESWHFIPALTLLT